MMTTKLGKYLRKARIDMMLTLRQMAFDLGISAPMLSNIEQGKRNLSPELQGKLESYLKFTSTRERDEFRRAVDLSTTEITISLKDATDNYKEVVIFIAKSLPDLEEEEIGQLVSILRANAQVHSGE